MTSISFYLGNCRRVSLTTHVIKSRVGKLKTKVSKLKKFSALRTEFSSKMFPHPGLKPCRRPRSQPRALMQLVPSLEITCPRGGIADSRCIVTAANNDCVSGEYQTGVAKSPTPLYKRMTQHHSALQKRLNRSRCCLRCVLMWAQWNHVLDGSRFPCEWATLHGKTSARQMAG